MWQLVAAKSVEAGGRMFQSINSDLSAGSAAKTRASILERNAQMADIESRQAINTGVYNINQFKRSFRSSQGTARASRAASGVVVNSGSSLDILMSNAGEASRQEAMMRYEAETAAYKKQQEAYDYRYQASITRAQAPTSFSMLGGILGVTASAAGGIIEAIDE